LVQYKDSTNQINNIATPLKYEYCDGKPSILIFGEMGNGKSTTGNYLIK